MRPLLFILLSALTACSSPSAECDSANPDDTACPASTPDDTAAWVPLDPEISDIDVVLADDSWTYTVSLVGWSGLVTLTIQQQQAEDSTWQEQHDLSNKDYARDGTWDIWYKTLFVVDEADQVDGVSTVFPADESQTGALTWMVTAWDMQLAAPADCVVWGLDIQIYEEHGCREWSVE